MKTMYALIPAVILAAMLVRGTEVQLDSCDAPSSFAVNNGGTATTAASHVEGSGAIHVYLPEIVVYGSVPDVGKTDYSWPGASSPFIGMEGLRFQVRGDGSCNWGIVSLYYDDNNYYRVYATFPMENGTWTEVTIPWRDFFQRNFRGPIEDHLDEIFTIRFLYPSNRDTGYPLQNVAEQSYDVDDIRAVDGLTLPPTPTPSGTSVDNVTAKLNAQQPVKIVVMGASVSWGLKCPDPENDCAAAQLQTLLRQHYGYDQITVINRSVGGFESYQGGSLLGRYCYDEEPVDLLIVGEYFYNDYSDAEALGQQGIDNIVANHERFFGHVLRRGSMDVMYMLSGLHVEPGYLTRMDNVADALTNLCSTMNITVADVYHEFQALGSSFLLDDANDYYDFPVGSGKDPVHYDIAAQHHTAQILLDTLIAASSNTLAFDPASYSVNEDAGTVTITVTRTGGSSGAVSVDYSTSDGTAVQPGDYSTTSGTLNWADGDSTAKTFTVPIVNDAVTENDEQFTITLSNAGGGATLGTSTATVTITDDDNPGTVQFSVSGYSVNEQDTDVICNVTVTRTGGSAGAASLQVAVTGGTATAADYSGLPAAVNFADGDSADKTVGITITGDTIEEGTETLTLELSVTSGPATLGSPATATVTIIDDDLLPKSKTKSGCQVADGKSQAARKLPLAVPAFIFLLFSALTARRENRFNAELPEKPADR